MFSVSDNIAKTFGMYYYLFISSDFGAVFSLPLWRHFLDIQIFALVWFWGRQFRVRVWSRHFSLRWSLIVSPQFPHYLLQECLPPPHWTTKFICENSYGRRPSVEHKHIGHVPKHTPFIVVVTHVNICWDKGSCIIIRVACIIKVHIFFYEFGLFF